MKTYNHNIVLRQRKRVLCIIHRIHFLYSKMGKSCRRRRKCRFFVLPYGKAARIAGLFPESVLNIIAVWKSNGYSQSASLRSSTPNSCSAVYQEELALLLIQASPPPTAYCFSQLKQGTYLIWLKLITNRTGPRKQQKQACQAGRISSKANKNRHNEPHSIP